MRKLVVSFAAVALALGTAFALTTVKAPAAHASPCTSPFFMEENDVTLYINGEGHNNPVEVHSGSASEFCVIYSGTPYWYEIQDQGTSECLNAGSDRLVYEDSCVLSTPEQWKFSSFTNPAYVENRHYGTSGYMTDSGQFPAEGDNVVATVINQNYEQIWRLPSA